MVLLQNHFVQNELPQFIFIECSIFGYSSAVLSDIRDHAGRGIAGEFD
jgi:hypothetical protein